MGRWSSECLSEESGSLSSSSWVEWHALPCLPSVDAVPGARQGGDMQPALAARV